MSWKQLSSEEKYKNPWITITEDKVETDSGKVLTWGVVHQKPAAFTIPWDGKYFTIIGLYRYPLNAFSWEFPAGGAEEEGDMQEAAERELKEETGIIATTMKYLGKFSTQNGVCTQQTHAYLATGISETGERELDAGEEGLQTKRVTYSELCAMIADGTFSDGQSLAAFSYLQASGWIKEQGL